MNSKALYLVLCLAGTALPYWRLAPFLREHGPNPALLAERLLADPVGGFFGLDVVVSSFALWVFVWVDGRRAGVRHLWAPVVANVLVGVSLGLPLFLYLRERRLDLLRGRSAGAPGHGPGIG